MQSAAVTIRTKQHPPGKRTMRSARAEVSAKNIAKLPEDVLDPKSRPMVIDI